MVWDDEAVADRLERSRDDLLRCRGGPESRNEQEFEQFYRAVCDELCAMLRGLEPPVQDLSTLRVHPDELYQMVIDSFELLAPQVLDSLIGSGASTDRIAAAITALQSDLTAKATGAADRHLEYLRDRAGTADKDERLRIVRELESQVIPGVRAAYSAFLDYEAGAGRDRLDRAMSLLTETMYSLREINAGLRRRLVGCSLEAALIDAVPGARDTLAVTVTGDESVLSEDVRNILVLALSDAVRAILRYSRSTRVEVLIRMLPREVRCVLTADGLPAIETPATPVTPLDRALASLQERVELLRGRMSKGPQEGGGSHTRIAVPLSLPVEPPRGAAVRHGRVLP